MTRTAKRSALSLALVLLAAAGCERPESPTPPESPESPSASGVPAIRNVQPDPDLLESQRGRSASTTTSADPGTSGAGAGATSGGVAAGDDPVGEVRQVLFAMARAAENRDPAALASHIDKPDVILPILTGAFEMQKKRARLEELVRDKLGTEVPEQVFGEPQGPGEMSMSMPGAPDPEELRRKLASGSLRLEQQGDAVVMHDANDPGEPDRFVVVDGKWTLQMPAEEEQMARAVGGLLQGMNTVVDELIEGIESDEITTTETLEQRAKELGETHIRPAMMKLMQRMMGGPGGAGGPGGGMLPPMGEE